MGDIPRLWLVGDAIVDTENGHRELGKWQDIAAEVLELRAENEKLRSLLASATESMQQQNQRISDDYDELTRLRALLPDARVMHGIGALHASRPENHVIYDEVEAWLEKLETRWENEYSSVDR